MKTLLLLAALTVTRPHHAVLSASSDEEAQQLLDKFTKGLGLPEAWPLEKHGARKSAGVFLGNFVLEIAVWPQVEPYQLLGLAIEVRDSGAAYEELRGRGLTIREQDREGGFYEDAMIAQLAGEGLGVFLCKPVASWLGPHLAKARQQFEAAKGGLAGVSGVAAIEMGMNAARRDAFEKLISPVKPEALDPPVQISEGRYQLRSIQIRCREPELAKRAMPAGVAIAFIMQ